MPIRPDDWTEDDWRLVANALARTRWDPDLDEDRATDLLAGVAAELDTLPTDLLTGD